jgi:hypothetical protein
VDASKPVPIQQLELSYAIGFPLNTMIEMIVYKLFLPYSPLLKSRWTKAIQISLSQAVYSIST